MPFDGVRGIGTRVGCPASVHATMTSRRLDSRLYRRNPLPVANEPLQAVACDRPGCVTSSQWARCHPVALRSRVIPDVGVSENRPTAEPDRTPAPNRNQQRFPRSARGKLATFFGLRTCRGDRNRPLRELPTALAAVRMNAWQPGWHECDSEAARAALTPNCFGNCDDSNDAAWNVTGVSVGTRSGCRLWEASRASCRQADRRVGAGV